MFFEDEKENLDNSESLDDLELDLEDDLDDESISWDELLKDSSSGADIVSIASNKNEEAKAPNTAKTKVQSIKEDPVEIIEEEDEEEPEIEYEDIQEDPPAKKDAFEVFGGSDTKEELSEADNVMDDEDQSILNELDNMEIAQELEGVEEDEEDSKTGNIGISTEDKNINIPMIAGIAFASILVIGSIIFMFSGTRSSKNINVAQNAPIQENIQQNETLNEQQEDINNEEKVPEEQIPVVDDDAAKKLKPDKKIVVQVESAGRLNPFLPTFDDFNNNYYAGIPSQILLPPDKYGNDVDAQDLMKISVSGILFDNVKPSAIVTINGIDYFVQKGDLVDDYLVMDINRQFVIVKKGTNIYKAGVGERFSQNTEISGAAIYGAGGIRQYKSAESYTSASDVEIHPVEEN